MGRLARTIVSSLVDTALGLLTILVGLVAFGMLKSGVEQTGPIWLSVMLIPIAWIAAVFIHEAGHAIAALIVGWRPVVISVWPIAYNVPNRTLVLKATVSASDAGGYVYCVPRRIESNTRLCWALMVAGGPCVSLLAGWGLLHASAIGGAASPGVYRVLVGFAGATGIFSGYIAIRTLIPKTGARGTTSDGRKLIGTFTRADLNQMAIVKWIEGMSHFSVRLRDVPAWMFAAARAENSKAVSLPPAFDRWDIGRALDAKHVDHIHVREQIETFKKTYPKYKETYPVDGWLDACDAYLAAVYEDDLARANTALAQVADKDRAHVMTFAARAAIAARTGDTAQVAANLTRFMSGTVHYQFPNRSFADIRSRIESIAKAIAASTPAATASVSST